ncbi:hypothetical protein SDC9_201859 [bioreactor metagenome]|uniref:Uncharacterized protein n=1 Tax=bioreactor metagenome TaxID=1076179 RepID=A0A645ITG8_9ZZZZ
MHGADDLGGQGLSHVADAEPDHVGVGMLRGIGVDFLLDPGKEITFVDVQIV